MSYLNAKLTTVRGGKVYEFVPTPDITAFELANILLYFYAANSVGTRYVVTDDEAALEKYFKPV